MQDPLSQSAPALYEDPASLNANAWEDSPLSQSMQTTPSKLSTDKPLPAPGERERQRSRNSSLISVSSGGKIYGQPDTPLPQPSVVNASGSNKAMTEFLRFRVTGITKSW